jgi:site-specific recombinase XerD
MNLIQIIQRVRDVCRVRCLSYKTEDTYLGHIKKYAGEVPKMPKEWASEQKMEAWLTREAHRGISASTQLQVFNALRFLYVDVLKQKLGRINALRPRRPAHVRHAPSVEETVEVLRGVRDVGGYPTRLITFLLYGCGLRVCEPLNLRIKDLRLSESKLVIRGAKGGKDRTVAIPCALMPALKRAVAVARIKWEQSVQQKMPVQLPGLLARKYPGAPFAWQWFWLFPAHKMCVDRRTGEQVLYRMHECNVQRAVKESAGKVDLDSVVTPHVLRHAFATHAMRNGACVRDVQEVMGHAHLETTMGYLSSEAERVRSPLDVLVERRIAEHTGVHALA